MEKKAETNSKNNLSSPAEIYIELFETVRDTLTQSVDKDRIQKVISLVIQQFSQNPYDRLLLYTYTFSEKNYIIVHISNNVILSIGFGIGCGLSNEKLLDLGTAAFCHDFGMAEFIHLFQKGKHLTEEENKLIKQHPHKSAQIFKDVYPDRIINMITEVHENVNGSGYPKGKSGVEISALSKMLSICDVFEALTHPRKFRRAFNPYEAMKIIIKKKKVMFDEDIVKKFVQYMSIYPIGTIVYLNTGEVAMVIGSNWSSPTRSVVQTLLTPKKEIDRSRRIINLLQDKMVYIISPVESRMEREVLRVLKPRGNINIL